MVFQTDREKLDAVQEIVNELFGLLMEPYIYGRLVDIDSICDVPLEGDYAANWDRRPGSKPLQ